MGSIHHRVQIVQRTIFYLLCYIRLQDKKKIMKRSRDAETLGELSSEQLMAMRMFFKACHQHSFGPWKEVDEAYGELKLAGFQDMPFEKFAAEVLEDRRPVVMHLGIWGAQEGKTIYSHTGHVISRFFGDNSEVIHLFLDLLPFSVKRVKTFKQCGGDNCFETKKMPLGVLEVWRRCAIIAGKLAMAFLERREDLQLKTSIYGMGKGAQEWISFCGMQEDVEVGPHPSTIRGHPGTLKSLLASASIVRAKLGLPAKADESEAVRNLFSQKGLSDKVATDGMACAMHLPIDVAKRVIVFGESWKLSKTEISQLMGLRWWTHALLQKGEDVLKQFGLSPFLIQSFWSCLSKSEDPVAMVQKIVDALVASGLDNYANILSIDGSWSCLGKADDPVAMVQKIVDALVASGLDNYANILSIDGSWSCLGKADDPVAMVQKIVDALVASGLDNYANILSIDGSWSCLGKADDPVAMVQKIVDALVASGLDNYANILSINSSWSCLGKADDLFKTISCAKSIPDDCQELLNRDGIWSVIGKFHGADFWKAMTLMVQHLGLAETFLLKTTFWDMAGKLIKVYLACIKQGISGAEIKNACYGLKPDMKKKTSKRFLKFQQVLKSLQLKK